MNHARACSDIDTCTDARVRCHQLLHSHTDIRTYRERNSEGGEVAAGSSEKEIEDR